MRSPGSETRPVPRLRRIETRRTIDPVSRYSPCNQLNPSTRAVSPRIQPTMIAPAAMLMAIACREWASSALAPSAALPPMTTPRKIPGTTKESKGVCRRRTSGTGSAPATRAIPPPTAETAWKMWSTRRVRRAAGMVRLSRVVWVVRGGVVVVNMAVPQPCRSGRGSGRRLRGRSCHQPGRR